MNWDDSVRNNASANRFEINHDGHQAIAQYMLGDGTINFIHTFVPKELRGKGVADALARAGLAFARAQGLKVIPTCAFFASYIKSHPETHDLQA